MDLLRILSLAMIFVLNTISFGNEDWTSKFAHLGGVWGRMCFMYF